MMRSTGTQTEQRILNRWRRVFRPGRLSTDLIDLIFSFVFATIRISYTSEMDRSLRHELEFDALVEPHVVRDEDGIPIGTDYFYRIWPHRSRYPLGFEELFCVYIKSFTKLTLQGLRLYHRVHVAPLPEGPYTLNTYFFFCTSSSFCVCLAPGACSDTEIHYEHSKIKALSLGVYISREALIDPGTLCDLDDRVESQLPYQFLGFTPWVTADFSFIVEQGGTVFQVHDYHFFVGLKE